MTTVTSGATALYCSMTAFRDSCMEAAAKTVISTGAEAGSSAFKDSSAWEGSSLEPPQEVRDRTKQRAIKSDKYFFMFLLPF